MFDSLMDTFVSYQGLIWRQWMEYMQFCNMSLFGAFMDEDDLHGDNGSDRNNVYDDDEVYLQEYDYITVY